MKRLLFEARALCSGNRREFLMWSLKQMNGKNFNQHRFMPSSGNLSTLPVHSYRHRVRRNNFRGSGERNSHHRERGHQHGSAVQGQASYDAADDDETLTRRNNTPIRGRPYNTTSRSSIEDPPTLYFWFASMILTNYSHVVGSHTVLGVRPIMCDDSVRDYHELTHPACLLLYRSPKTHVNIRL